MPEYAGQKKVGRDIERAAKRADARDRRASRAPDSGLRYLRGVGWYRVPRKVDAMQTYTVIGVWDHEGSDDTNLIIAGVVEGDVDVVDLQDNVGDYGAYTRFATTVEARDPGEAERLVLEEYDPA